MASRRRIHAIFWIVPLLVAALFFGVLAILLLQSKAIDERIRASMSQILSERFHSDVDLQSVHIYGFPRLRADVKGMTLRQYGRRDLPPLIQIGSLTFSLNYLDLIRPIKHVSLVTLDNMVISVPPREPKRPQPPRSKANQTAAKVVVDKIVCTNVHILILPKDPGKTPLDWDIHELVLHTVSPDQPLSFSAKLTNGKPIGEITSSGKFGPWNPDSPGDSPVSGQYQFTNADLNPFPGIGGTLSSTGNYQGVLDELEVKGQTDTPNFSLDRAGRPVPLHTDFSATVDGTNGDTYLHPVNATLAKSPIICNGKVVREPEKHGHLIKIDANVPQGRIEDFLNLAVNSEKPLLSGPVRLRANLLIPPGKVKTLDKMILDGHFNVDDATWSSESVREKLRSLSRHAQGKPEDLGVGSSVSDLAGDFHLENGVIHFQRLTFSVPGAQVALKGTYAIRGGELDFTGELRLQAELSQMVTGTKSILLKAIDPFFKKEGAGAVVPISITGTKDQPTFGVILFHKTINYQTGGQKSKRANSRPSR